WDAIYYCPHTKDDNCNCRKPKPGMVKAAAKAHNIDLSRSWFVGDSVLHDIPLAKSLGLKSILIPKRTDTPESVSESQADYVVPDLMSAVQIIKGNIFEKK
ncbi:TPA: HAD-IIIA family hydrolase, partial [archaeon]|nr:HAD-IIIA family hydrolase [Candidatus Naiadarchaeales archaeon SRR2090159.bin1288]